MTNGLITDASGIVDAAENTYRLEDLKRLREPFPPNQIGKLPRAGVQLDFVGHAHITARLLDVDPYWSWEPFAVGEDGLPRLDEFGGLWIRLTVCGVTRIGYGDAEGKKGPVAMKVAIGDALRNAGMRFGLALDLWAKADISDGHSSRQSSDEMTDVSLAAANEARGELLAKTSRYGWDGDKLCKRFADDYGGQDLLAVTDLVLIKAFGDVLVAEANDGDLVSASMPMNPSTAKPEGDLPSVTLISDAQLRKLNILLAADKITGHDERAQWCSDMIGRKIASTKELTAGEASTLIDKMEPKK